MHSLSCQRRAEQSIEGSGIVVVVVVVMVERIGSSFRIVNKRDLIFRKGCKGGRSDCGWSGRPIDQSDPFPTLGATLKDQVEREEMLMVDED